MFQQNLYAIDDYFAQILHKNKKWKSQLLFWVNLDILLFFHYTQRFLRSYLNVLEKKSLNDKYENVHKWP